MINAAAVGTSRRLPIGAEPGPQGTHFRVWAPNHEQLDVVIADGDARGDHEMFRDDDGYFQTRVDRARAGARYRFRSKDGVLAPDPASRFQPEGPHGASVVVDPESFHWTDSEWTGPDEGRQVIYEMHMGTFTKSGTWTSAAAHLPGLADLGVTILELMPVAETVGQYNWGYDGVAPFAPTHRYGAPDDMRRFIDRAHELGLAVILDVVYNHMGPDGCYLRHFAEAYFSETYATDWGPALNFDGVGAGDVRTFFLANVEYWIREFHLDGLRFDATDSIHDSGPRHILAELTERVRTAAGDRRTWVVAENEAQDVRLITDIDDGGFGMDALWNDDFHHTAMVALTGAAEAYYTDYAGSPQELISCARHGFLYQGQHYAWQHHRRGTPTRGLPRGRFVNFIQNHDQIANSIAGLRIDAAAGAGEVRAMTAFTLLMPGTAMLFQGQEFAASSPFLYFADHEPDLAARVHAGRREFLAQFRSLRDPAAQERIPDPAALDTFTRSRIDQDERQQHAPVLALHRDLIRLSRTDDVFARQDCDIDGAVLGERALVLRYHVDGNDRLLVMNLGPDEPLHVVPDPLLAPPLGMQWVVLFSTENPQYGGRGAANPELEHGWLVQGHCTTVLVPAPLGST